MSIEFTNKTILTFGGLSRVVPADTTDAIYTTPSAVSETLGDLARLSYLSADFRWRLEVDEITGAGEAEIKVMAGAAVLETITVPLAAKNTVSGILPLDITSIFGGTQLKVALSMKTAADAGRTIQVGGELVVSHPLVIGA